MRLSYFLIPALFGVRFTHGSPKMPEIWRSSRFERLPDGFEIVSKQVLTNEENNSLFIDIDLGESTIKEFKSVRTGRRFQSVVQMMENCFPGFVARIRRASNQLKRIRSLWNPPNTLVVRLHHVE
ncbi:uncharacterized protein MELLADRAFT_108011 [Melampsora larici-populina 98AG31]|uniref:Secreted protein n=1 Tax=Melampsora larici-populina (strain 98AG31 / pathotype 3-4-7) TaxID=747676 RepID=F4RRN6_MELLP|nr:uncharacterized protein MELLADRAFT_108011 [Melampsora larici-populina 98AG31]EGG04958.1 hypothetical protein MELLADRAFT_108011 [Melampsora larici-populina 98AG31]